jgi:hypothetical protein
MLKKLLEMSPTWRRRVARGIGFDVQQVARRRDVANLAVCRSIDFVVKSLPTTLEPNCYDDGPPVIPPYREYLTDPRAKLSKEVIDTCLRYLDMALLHAPDDSTAWYMRGLCLLARGDTNGAARDMRRLVLIERDNPDAKIARLRKLESLQGVLRMVASYYADHVTVRTSAGDLVVSAIDVP